MGVFQTRAMSPPPSQSNRDQCVPGSIRKSADGGKSCPDRTDAADRTPSPTLKRNVPQRYQALILLFGLLSDLVVI
jgi:hypothetical protein